MPRMCSRRTGEIEGAAIAPDATCRNQDPEAVNAIARTSAPATVPNHVLFASNRQLQYVFLTENLVSAGLQFALSIRCLHDIGFHLILIEFSPHKLCICRYHAGSVQMQCTCH